MTFARSQRGLSALGWMVMLALVAFATSIIMKMVPHYMDFMSLDKMIKAAESEKASEIVTINDFYAYIERGMSVNNIRDLDLKKIMNVTLDGDRFNVHLDYDTRESLIGNMDLVAHFDRDYSVRKP